MTAALELSRCGLTVDLVEKSHFAGGHAIQFACKATDRCVKCGACLAQEKLAETVSRPNIRLHRASRILSIRRNRRFKVTIETGPLCIDPQKCSHCGLCFEECPENGALMRGYSPHQAPPYAVNEDNCLYFRDRSCTVCRDICPQQAIDLDQTAASGEIEADAVVLASGFQPFDPAAKPYGYGKFADVVTTLELERMLRRKGAVLRPSDHRPAGQMAFIQCVGSRDAKTGHLWCSRTCCASALRMAHVIRARQPDTEITIFYIDIQTFGKDFETFYRQVRHDLRWVRAIPGDIFGTRDHRLRVVYYDQQAGEGVEELFDLVVLAVGMTPGADTARLAEQLHLPAAHSGFLAGSEACGSKTVPGVFTAGAATGPMTIAEAIASGGGAAWRVLRYLAS